MSCAMCNHGNISIISRKDLEKILDPQNTFDNNLQIIKYAFIQDRTCLNKIKNELINNNEITEKDIDKKITLCNSVIDSIDNIINGLHLQNSYRNVYNCMYINGMNIIAEFICRCEEKLKIIQ